MNRFSSSVLGLTLAGSLACKEPAAASQAPPSRQQAAATAGSTSHIESAGLPPLTTAAEPHQVDSVGAAAPVSDGSKSAPELPAAARWLEALRDRDVAKLAARSVFPLQLRDTREEGRCEAQRTATDAASLGGAVECLMQDELLMSLMRAAPGAPPVETQPEGYIKPWAKQWSSEVPNGARAVLSYYDRSDAWLSLILWVDAAGVRAVWKTGTDVRAQVAIAEQWRAALRKGDAAELTRLASYPFEVRDEGANSHCKKAQVAKVPEEMPAALRCLLADQVLQKALHDSPESKLQPERSVKRVPGAFRDWWRPKEHEGLWPIWTLSGTKAGQEFDLTWLVAKDGVRAFWKRGSVVQR